MNGAPWGWIALIGAIAVLFTASNYDQSGSNKVATILRQELKTVASERDRTQTERNEARDQAEGFFTLATTLHADLSQAQAELAVIKSERDRLRKELTSLSNDRTQLQQSVSALQQERSVTKRNVEQLRQGLQQLLSQADSAASLLTGPPPGFAQINFEEMKPEPVPAVKVAKVASKPVSDTGTYYPDEPLNDVQ